MVGQLYTLATQMPGERPHMLSNHQPDLGSMNHVWSLGVIV